MAEGFFERIRRIAREFLTGRQTPEEEPTAPPPEEAPEQPVPEEYVPEDETEVIIYPPSEDEVQYEEPPQQEGGCVTGYYEGRIEGRYVRVKPRWYAAQPDIDCIRSIIQSSGNRTWYTIVISGTPYLEYPGKEGEDIIHLGYVVHRNYLFQVAYGAGTSTALDFVNQINDLYQGNKIDHWVSVETVSIIDN